MVIRVVQTEWHRFAVWEPARQTSEADLVAITMKGPIL